MLPRIPTCSAFVAASIALAPALLAGGSGESALLVVNPASAEALYVANHYRAARWIPDGNLLYLEPGAPSYAAFVANVQPAFLGTLASRRVEHVDYVIVMPGTSFFVPAPGLVSDGCSPVTRFSIAAPYGVAHNSSAILAGTTAARLNRYFGADDEAIAFDSSIAWFGGLPSTQPSAERYFVAAMLGYTGARGNTVAEIIDTIDRSAAIDGSAPNGTFYFFQTTDPARSTPRHGWFPAVTAAILLFGGMAQHLYADMPSGQTDCQGIMTGLADPAIASGNFTILPGAFCDHLTSYAGTFDSGSQTKMSEWITKGASATSGTVEEPCNYPGKFPHARMHLYYRKGLTLGEAWLRSMRYYTFQNLLYGDPLTRPYAAIPLVGLESVPAGPVSGSVPLTPIATPVGSDPVQDVELYVDGVLVRRGTLGDSLPLQTELLDDGWHELRVLAYEASSVRSVGSWIGSVLVENQGLSAWLAPAATSGDLGTSFDFDLAAFGAGLVELRLVCGGRVLGTTSANPGTVRVFGQNLGAGPARVQAEALFASGARVRSAPLQLAIAFAGGGVGPAPVAFDHSASPRVDLDSVIELPAAYRDDPSTAVFSIVSTPAQASFVPGPSSGYRVLRPNPGASGSDSFVFRVTTPSGTSNDAVVTLSYRAAPSCPIPSVYCSSAPNSVGPGAFIDWTGSTSVLANDLRLAVNGARPNKPGIFYYGPNQIQVPFGDGFRCVGAGGVGVFRLPIVYADSFGYADYPLDLNSARLSSGPGEIQPGEHWNFQFWYRDPGGPGGTNFNLSDALGIAFCP